MEEISSLPFEAIKMQKQRRRVRTPMASKLLIKLLGRGFFRRHFLMRSCIEHDDRPALRKTTGQHTRRKYIGTNINYLFCRIFYNRPE